MPKVVFPNSYCMVEITAEGSWERSQRRHYPDIHNHSNVELQDTPASMRIRRILMIDSTHRNEKRHYNFYTGRSYLEDYY